MLAWLRVVIVGGVLLGAGVVERSEAQPVGSPWPQWRGSSIDGISSDSRWLSANPTPQKVWEVQVGIGYTPAAVVNGKLYTMGWRENKDYVQCLDAATGKELWSFNYDAPLNANSHAGGPSCTPAVDEGKVYTLGRDLKMHCAEAATGKVLWRKDLKVEYGSRPPQWGFSGSVMIWGDTAYVEGGRTIAMDKATGKEKWKSQDYGAGYSTPMPFELEGKKLLAVFNAFGLVVLNAADGSEIAKHRWETSYGVNAATPIVAGNRIFISSGYGRGCALLQLQGNQLTVLWENKGMSAHMASPVLIDEHLYGFDEGKLTCLSLATGETKWMQRGLGKGALTAANGKLVVMSERGELIVAPAKSSAFEPIIRFAAVPASHPVWIMPVVAEGRLYTRNPAGLLVCYSLAEK
jgi:outer membrane protein assembly factor BamB